MLFPRFRLFLLTICFACFLTGVVFAEQETVFFEIHWLPQAQFAGYIVAKEKGFFKKHLPCKQIEIVWPHTSDSSLENLHKNSKRFCTAWFPDALFYRCLNSDKKIVCISQVMQKTPVMLVTKNGNGIESPKDLDGKRVQVWHGGVGFMTQAFFDKQKIKPVLVPQQESMMPFLYDIVSAASAMYYNEYHVLLERGLTKEGLKTFLLSDYDMSFPGDGIYCDQNVLDADPKLCEGILQACHDGWNYAIDPKNEAEILDWVLAYSKRAEMITSRSHQRWMLRTIKEDLEPNPEQWGNLRREDYEQILDIIRGSEKMKSATKTVFPAYSDFFRNPLTSGEISD